MCSFLNSCPFVPLICLNLRASGTVLACEYFEVDCCKNFGEAFCVLWNWNQGCFLHESAQSSSPALFLSFPSPLLLHSQSCALHFLWSQPGRWEITAPPWTFVHTSSPVWELNKCLFPFGEHRWEVQPLDKPAHRAADTLGATPNWGCRMSL